LGCDRYLGDGATDRREILHDGTYRSRTRFLPFWGGAPWIPQIQTFGRLIKRMSRNQLDESFLEVYSIGRESPIRKICIFCPVSDIVADRRENLLRPGREFLHFWWRYL